MRERERNKVIEREKTTYKIVRGRGYIVIDEKGILARINDVHNGNVDCMRLFSAQLPAHTQKSK